MLVAGTRNLCFLKIILTTRCLVKPKTTLTVVDKTIQAYNEFSPVSVVIGGGVSASPELRRQLAERLPIAPHYTDPKLATDNGAMIATLGAFKAALFAPTADPYTLDIEPNLSM
ncbi:hypothetical protein EB118_24510 [bacterium]|nr:hypothetical protein [bacterium]